MAGTAPDVSLAASPPQSPGIVWASWPALRERLARTGHAEALRYVDALDPTRPGCDLHSLLLFLLTEEPLATTTSQTVFAGLAGPVRSELLLLLTRLEPRLPGEPLLQLLWQFLEQRAGLPPTHSWDVQIAEEMLQRLQPPDHLPRQGLTAVAAVTRGAAYQHAVSHLQGMVAADPSARTWAATAGLGQAELTAEGQTTGETEVQQPSPKRRRVSSLGGSQSSAAGAASPHDQQQAAGPHTPAFMLSQEPRGSQQLEGQMRQPDDFQSSSSNQQEDDEGEPAIMFSPAPGSPEARYYVAAPPALLPMAAPPPRPAAGTSAVTALPGVVTATDTAEEVESAAGAGGPAAAAAEQESDRAAEWASLRVSVAALRVSTAAAESEAVIEQVATSLEGALVAQELGACMTGLGLGASAPEGVVDEALLALARRLITVDCSFRLATEFIKGAVLPRIASLAVTASRPLLATCQLVTSVQPRAAQGNLLLPLLCDHNMGSAQAELVLRAIKGDGKDGAGRLPLEMVQALLAEALGDAPPPPWGDPLLHTWHSVLGLRLALSGPAVLTPLLSALEQQREAQKTSQKYCNVLFALVGKYGAQLAAEPPSGLPGGQAHLDLLEHLLGGCTSFVRKPALTALAKLKKTLA